jgi:hypothetical protein
VFLPLNFLNNTYRFNGNWRLDGNLLAIIDSYNFHIDKVGTWIKQIIESDTADKKIRLLILEREGFHNGYPIWIRKLNETVGDTVLSALCYKNNLASLELKPPDLSVFENPPINYAGAAAYIPGAGRRLKEFWEKPDAGFKNPALAPLIIQAADNGASADDFTDVGGLLDYLYALKIKQIQSVIDSDDLFAPVFTATALSLAYSVIVPESVPGDKYVSVICRIIKYGEDSPDIVKVKENFGKINGYMYDGSGGGQPDLFCVYSVLKIVETYGRPTARDRIVVNRAWAHASRNTANFLCRAIDLVYGEYELPGLKHELVVLLAPPRREVRRT